MSDYLQPLIGWSLFCFCLGFVVRGWVRKISDWLDRRVAERERT